MTTIRRKPRPSVPKAKNFMRRVVAEILQPSPSGEQLTRMWAHFAGKCVYCLKPLEPAGRWHLDHLLSGDDNHIGNRVPACPGCNGDEKRERAWREFIATKLTGAALDVQVALIDGWVAAQVAPALGHPPEVRDALHQVEMAIRDFGVKCAQLKEAMHSAPRVVIDHDAAARELREQFVRLSPAAEGVDVEVGIVNWNGPHTPELRWQVACSFPLTHCRMRSSAQASGSSKTTDSSGRADSADTATTAATCTTSRCARAAPRNAA